MLQLEELSAYCLDFQAVADMKGLEMDTIMMYQAFYEQQPSYEHLIGTGEYDSKMDSKYDYCLNCINETLEFKIQYDKLQRNE